MIMSAAASPQDDPCRYIHKWRLTMTAAPASDRQKNGQFAPGNMGGPGNPHARQVAALRREILKQVTPESVGKIVASVLYKAELGDLACAKFIFHYAVGRPAPYIDPDRLEIDEQKLRKQARVDLDKWQKSLQMASAQTANALDQAVWPDYENKLAWKAAHLMGLLDHWADKGNRPPSPNGDNGKVSIVDPSPNGGNGGKPPANGSYRGEDPQSRGHGPSRPR
jgi:hypothetical protein